MALIFLAGLENCGPKRKLWILGLLNVSTVVIVSVQPEPQLTVPVLLVELDDPL